MGLFSRVKNWIDNEVLTASDLNAEFNNVINNMKAEKADGYSSTVSQMRTQVSPGAVGTESLATSTADELTRLRYVLNRIVGGTYWYDAPADSLLNINARINSATSLPDNRIMSGRVDAFNQPMFLQASGSAPTVKALGATTNLNTYINGTQYLLTTNVTSPSLTLGPSANHTAVLDGNLTKEAVTIAITTAGSEFTAAIGSYRAFKIVTGVDTEYLIGFVNSATSITRCIRGGLFDSSDLAYPPIAHTSADTITMLSVNWIFLKNDGTLSSTYRNPAFSGTAPDPTKSDYWYDFNTNKWKYYAAGTWTVLNGVLLGQAVCDSTNCLYSRSFDFYKVFDSENTLVPAVLSTTEIRTQFNGWQCNVYGTLLSGKTGIISWNITTDLDVGVTEASSTWYYLYLTDKGVPKMSDEYPLDRKHDLGGLYHPAKPWRCVGWCYNDGSSDIISAYTVSSALVRSTGCGTYTASGTSDIPNLSVTIATTGKPVFIGFIPDETAGTSYVQADGTSTDVFIDIYRGATQIAVFELQISGPSYSRVPFSGFTIDPVPTGTYTYKATLTTSLGSATIVQLKLLAYEIGA